MSKLLAIIPARGGSKGIPKKNIIPVNGKPLIAWTIESACLSNKIDHVIASSDDDEIIKVAKEWGCDAPFRRPKNISGDKASSIDVINHAITHFPDYDYIALLQPTSPLRTEYDIDEAYSTMIRSGASSCTSVCLTDESPYLMHKIDNDGFLQEFLTPPVEYLRRQDLPATYKLNGAIYMVRLDWFKENQKLVSRDTVGYIMPSERSIDIDDVSDIDIVETLLDQRTSTDNQS